MQVRPGDQIVLRLWRWDVEKLIQQAEDDLAERRDLGQEDAQYSVSVWMSEPIASSDDLQAAKDAVVARAREEGLTVKRTGFTTRRRLEEEGFFLQPSPPDDHYDVLLGHRLDHDRVTKLQNVFFENEERV